MSTKRALVWHVGSVVCSLAVAGVAGVALPLGEVAQGTPAETALLAVFFVCYTGLLTLYWYRNSYEPDRADGAT